MYEVYQICFKIIMQCEENDYEVMKLRDDRKKEWWVSMSNEQCVTPAFSILSEPFSGLFYPSFGFPVLTRVSHVFHLNFKSILFSLLVDVLLPFPRGHTHVNPRSGCNTFLCFSRSHACLTRFSHSKYIVSYSRELPVPFFRRRSTRVNPCHARVFLSRVWRRFEAFWPFSLAF